MSQTNWNDPSLYVGVDWNDPKNYEGVDWSKVDYSGVDWSTVNYGNPQSFHAPVPSSAPTLNPQSEPKIVVGSNDSVIPLGETAEVVAVDGGGPNEITVTNSSEHEQDYAIFTNPGTGPTSSFGVPNGFVHLKPGESAVFRVPAQYSGYVQQMNNYTFDDYMNNKPPAADNFRASRAEVTFDADGMLWFNDSNIDGYNSAVKMTSNDQVAGSNESVMDKLRKAHPGLIMNVGGQDVAIGPQFFTPGTNEEAVAAFDEIFNGTSSNSQKLNTYVLPNDDMAMRATRSHSLTVNFDDA